MGVSLFYFIAIIPVLVGGYFWLKSQEVVWQEWIGGSAVGFLLAGTFHALCLFGMTSDVETWSGQIEKAVHHPMWVEKYTTTEHHSSGSGKNRRTWTTTKTHYRTHDEYWEAVTSIGDSHRISEDFFTEIHGRFGGEIKAESGSRPGFYSGDRNDYVSYNESGYVYPVTSQRMWSNKVKAAPSIFSYSKVPTNVTVFQWPRNDDWTMSDRLVGTASALFDLREFDLLNSRVGPAKKVNLIMVGWDSEGPEISQWQEAAWIGGKKNDLVVCFGGMTAESPAKWSRVFGWTDEEIVKRNIASLMLKPMSKIQLLAAIEDEVRRNYKIKDWSKLDYLTPEPPGWSYGVFILTTVLTQILLYCWFHNNNFGKLSGRFTKAGWKFKSRYHWRQF